MQTGDEKVGVGDGEDRQARGVREPEEDPVYERPRSDEDEHPVVEEYRDEQRTDRKEPYPEKGGAVIGCQLPLPVGECPDGQGDGHEEEHLVHPVAPVLPNDQHAERDRDDPVYEGEYDEEVDISHFLAMATQCTFKGSTVISVLAKPQASNKARNALGERYTMRGQPSCGRTASQDLG